MLSCSELLKNTIQTSNKHKVLFVGKTTSSASLYMYVVGTQRVIVIQWQESREDLREVMCSKFLLCSAPEFIYYESIIDLFYEANISLHGNSTQIWIHTFPRCSKRPCQSNSREWNGTSVRIKPSVRNFSFKSCWDVSGTSGLGFGDLVSMIETGSDLEVNPSNPRISDLNVQNKDILPEISKLYHVWDILLNWAKQLKQKTKT